MSQESESAIARREFLKSSAIAAVGIGCLSLDLREALAEAKQAGKPLFTANNINRLIRANPTKSKSGQGLGREAAQDVKSFIRNHFHLTAQQEQELESVSNDDIVRVQDKIRDLVDKNGKLVVTIQSETKRASNDGESDPYVKAGFSEPLGIDIGIKCGIEPGQVSCHFTITKK